MSFCLITDRLVLKEMNINDAPYLYELNANPNVLQYTGDFPFENIEDAEAFLESYDQYEIHGIGRWSIFSRSSGEYIGWCGLKYHAQKDIVDLGFRIKEEAWNNGYATESGKICLEYGFSKMKYNSIISRAHHDNHASLRVIEKLGFSPVGSENEQGQLWLVFSMTKHKYFSLNS